MPRGRPRGQKRKRSQGQQPSKVGWADLPLELREMILEALEYSLEGGKAASYASVCKEWNRILEPYIFKRLKLSVQRIQELQYFITDRRRLYVQSIWFQFERAIGQHELDNVKFSDAVFYLFQTLSEWGERNYSGIVLELSAFSASDPTFSMKDIVPKDLKDVDVTEDNDALNTMYEKSPLRRMHRLSAKELFQQTMLTSFYRPLDFPNVLEVPFPTVKLITDLTVRRQMHSSFFTKHMERLVKALPRLEFLTFEPSTLSFLYGSGWENRGLNPNIQTVEKIIKEMPFSIRRLQLLEDDSSLYTNGARRSRVGTVRRELGRLIANTSQDKRVEAIAISFIIDASDFFSDFWGPQITQPPDEKLVWVKLTSLVLTSSLISPNDDRRLSDLLIAAARAARHMPSLEIMELYNAEAGYGGIFTYIHDEEGSIIRWDSSWKWKFPSEVIYIWKMAAKVHGTDVFDQSLDLIRKRDLGWPGRIISLLRTRFTVVHPLTYGNMMDGLNYM